MIAGIGRDIGLRTFPGRQEILGAAVAGGDAPSVEHRLFLRDLDSVTQHQNVAGEPEEWTPASVLPESRAAIRVAMLLGQRVVITNSQLFDGRAFLAWGPGGFEDVVGSSSPVSDRGLPLTVLAKDEGLSQALVGLVRPDDGSPYLRAFKFSALDKHDAELVMARITGIRVAVFDERVRATGAAQALGETLRECGLLRDRCDALAERWQAWLDAESLVRVSPGWVRASERSRPSGVDLDRLYAATGGDPSACQWVAEYVDPDSKIVNRSRAHGRLDELCEMDREARERLRGLVDDRYNMSIAWQRGCDYVETGLLGTPGRQQLVLRSTEYGRRDDRNATNHIYLEGRSLSGLAEMPREVFSALRYQTRDAADEWWSGDRRTAERARRTIAYAIRLATDQPRPSRLFRRSAFILMVVVLSALALGAVSGLSSWWLLGAATVLAVITHVPEIETLWSLRGRSLRKDLDATELDII